MYYLPTTNTFGKLKVLAEYVVYDCPRTFIARCKTGKVFVHWVDELDDADVWFYVKVTDSEQENIENGRIQLRDVFCFKDVFEVTTPYDETKKVKERFIPKDAVDFDYLPCEGIVLSKDDEHGFHLDEKNDESFLSYKKFHEIRIYQGKKHKPVPWSGAQPILSAWGAICESIISSSSANDDEYFYPRLAKVGSYQQQFEASHNEEIISKIIEVSKILQSNAVDKGDRIKNLGIDPVLIESLMKSLEDSKLKLDLISHSGGVVSTLDFKDFNDSSQKISEYNQKYISSAIIPQADEVERIIRLVELKANGGVFNYETESITYRQVSYYQTAARILGYIKRNGTVTPAGYKLSTMGSERLKLLDLMEKFELTDCGWAWMKCCGVDKIIDIDTGTAKNFLLEYSVGLSENTAIRRARTLERWLREFKILHA